MCPRPVPSEFVTGFRISRFRLERQIGAGGYGCVFLAFDTESEQFCAMKIEKEPFREPGLTMELEMLPRIAESRFTPQFILSGTDGPYRYVVMAVMGPALRTIRQIKGTLGALSTVVAAIEMLRCLEDVHSRGIIHADFKVGNVLFTGDSEYPLVIVDFGLARYAEGIERGRIVGTTRYISPRVHRGYRAEVCDDLVSWIYSFVELYVGELPWANCSTKSIVRLKRRITGKKFCPKLPVECQEVVDYVVGLEPSMKPDYAHLYQLLRSAKARIQVSTSEPLDWDGISMSQMSEISPIDVFGTRQVFATRSTIEMNPRRCCALQ